MYQVLPLTDTPERAKIMKDLIVKTCTFDSAFSDFQSVCSSRCFEQEPWGELCPLCLTRLRIVAVALATGLTWEVWKTEEEPELVGIIRLSEIRPGEDALGHYIFFDHDLRGKTEVLKEMIDWCFSEHEGWTPLRRLTIQVPDFAFALVRHATKKLGFGGEFTHSLKGKKVPVEGVKRKALLWRGSERDLLFLGILNPTALRVDMPQLVVDESPQTELPPQNQTET